MVANRATPEGECGFTFRAGLQVAVRDGARAERESVAQPRLEAKLFRVTCNDHSGKYLGHVLPSLRRQSARAI